MRAHGNDRLLLTFFAALALSSVGLKAYAGPPRGGLDSFRAEIEAQLASSLRAQGFATSITHLRMQSSIVYGRRGACRLSVRDARLGESNATAFAQDAAGIGPVRYLYRGRDYASPPTFAMRLGRLQTELLDRAGLNAALHIPVAIASSPGCGRADFGLDDVRVG
jgi:hypothetical protein